jgi:ribosomal protein S12 methylthiotransferase accessory factor
MGNTAENKAWQFMHSSKRIDYSRIPSYEHDDVLDDIEFVLARLKSAKLERVIVANITDSSIKVPVVRVIVPGLETFKVSKSVVGYRGMRYYNSWC